MIFTILCPNFTHFSAGVECLWRLGEYLIDLGHEVHYLNYQSDTYPAPDFSRMVKITDSTTRGIVIAPETFVEIETPHIRWALNKPGLLGGPTTYPPGCRVYHFSAPLEASARAAAKDGESRQFTLGVMTNLGAVKSDKKHSLWYRGKYSGPVNLSSHEGEIELTRSWPPTKQQYWDLLQNATSLKSYDDFTGVTAEAHLAGCEVFIWGKGGWEPYIVPDDIIPMTYDYDRNLASVKAFAEDAIAYFSLPKPLDFNLTP